MRSEAKSFDITLFAEKTQFGETFYIVEITINGATTRHSFQNKPEAERFKKLETARQLQGRL